MIVQDLVDQLGVKVMAMTREGSRREIRGGFVGDVLSHVMANAKPGFVWVTVQTHENVIAIASLLDVACVLVCQRELLPETCQRAADQGVTLLWSADDAFQVTGRIYSALTACRETGGQA
ncbi:MAG TPA: serine kinase [Firmicutes bacterium]|nr:serine kinase [Candidatus Fermentithermobacillaceae bacterium]